MPATVMHGPAIPCCLIANRCFDRRGQNLPEVLETKPLDRRCSWRSARWK
ncbi:hypothetical protein DEV91_14116 [Phyllobacterium brassicacearum]|nr:hypothetical protein DEV91_14116 [Phyllobacterium brassicacearum]